MSAYEPSINSALQAKSVERVRYFPRQLITADDMRAEQDYFRERLRRHNRYLHGWGVVCGCEVKLAVDKDHPWRVRVCGGYLITPGGDEVQISEAVDFDLAVEARRPADPCALPSPCAPAAASSATERVKVHLAVCYAECSLRPVRIHPAGCGCDDAACEYSRVRDSFELLRLGEADLPRSHKRAAAGQATAETTGVVRTTGDAQLLQMPPCPPWPEDNCVVLATVTLPLQRAAALVEADIAYDHRRILYTLAMLQALQPGTP
jgi:hypothetical protein